MKLVLIDSLGYAETIDTNVAIVILLDHFHQKRIVSSLDPAE